MLSASVRASDVQDRGTGRCRVGPSAMLPCGMAVRCEVGGIGATVAYLGRVVPSSSMPLGAVAVDRLVACGPRCNPLAALCPGEVALAQIDVVPAEHIQAQVIASSDETLMPPDATTAASILRHLLAPERIPIAVGATINAALDPSAGPYAFKIIAVSGNSDAVFVNEATSVEMLTQNTPSVIPDGQGGGQICSIGGLTEAIATLRDLLLIPLTHQDDLKALGADCPKGLLLYGAPGVGKTLLVREVTRACAAPLVVANASDIVGVALGESEENLRKLFVRAQTMAKESGRACVLFLDELDALCPVREGSGTASRLVGQLLTLLDGLSARGDIFVIGATNRPNAVDPALRRPGRFDREIAVGVPTVEQRLDILRALTVKVPLDDSVDLNDLARRSLGFVGADLAALVRDASRVAMRAGLSKVLPEHLMDALEHSQPSTLRESIVQLDRGITWDDIGGLEDVKQRLRQAVEWPIQHRQQFAKLGLRAPRGVLLYGPPGCSKTTLVKAMATSVGATFFSLSGAAIYSPYIGEAEATVRDLFSRGRSAVPAVLFFDEIDAIVSKRSFNASCTSGRSGDGSGVQERVLSTLLNEMDGIESAEGILVVAATNRPDLLDAALLRPGRFDELIYVPPPDRAARESILHVHTRKMTLAADVSLEHIATQSNFYSGADVENVCREAAMAALRENVATVLVHARHFNWALRTIRGSLPPDVVAQYPIL